MRVENTGSQPAGSGLKSPLPSLILILADVYQDGGGGG